MSRERASFSLVFFIIRAKPKKMTGECPIYLKININGEKVRLPIMRNIHPSQWDSSRTRVKGRTKEAEVFNKYLDAIRLRANKFYNELLLTNEVVSPHMLRDALLGINTGRPKSILAVWDELIERMESLIGKETTYSTMQKYRTCRNHFQEFLRKNYKVSDTGVTQVNGRMIDSFEHFLKVDKGCSYNTSIKFLQNMKKVTNTCIRNGWIKNDPFDDKKLSTKPVARPYLSEEELKRIIDLKVPFKRLDRVKDLFLFACFTGLSYSDVQKLTRKEVEVNSDGTWIRTSRTKTGGLCNIPLLDIPWQIIRKHNPFFEDMYPDDKVFIVISNQKLNSYLKEIAELSRITKQLSFHIARHTFATTVTMMNGVPIESVSKMLGHKNLTSTQHYARIVDRKVFQDMKELSSKLNNRHTSPYS